MSEPVLDALLAHPFFQQPPPKFTGRELFGRAMVEEVLGSFRRQHEHWSLVGPKGMAPCAGDPDGSDRSDHRRRLPALGPAERSG